MKKSLFPFLAAGAGGALLLWAAVAIRGDAEAPSKPRRAPRPVASEASPVSSTTAAPTSGAPGAPRSAASPGGGLDLSVVKARIEAMEARVRTLEARRDLLKVENDELSGQIAERSAEARARATAEWRVRSLAKKLNLTESQQAEIRELWTRWSREDQSGRASPSTWRSREADLRARLSSEQSLELQEQTAAQIARDWSYMGRKLGSAAGAPAEAHGRLQQSIGDAPIPNSALLREAHEADWRGLMRVAAERMRPMLTSEQSSSLDQFAARYTGRAK